jgi:hypothetical protein
VRKLGFTGSQHPLPQAQIDKLREVLEAKWAEGFRQLDHGDCINGDKWANDMAREIGYRTKGHPPIKESKRAFCKVDEEAEAKEYLDRNDDIAADTEELVACPSTFQRVPYSGTWATVTRAERRGRKVTFIFRDGSMREMTPRNGVYKR